MFEAQVRALTEHLSNDYLPVLPGNSSPSVPLVGVLNKGVALVDRAANDLPVLAEDDFDVLLGDQQGVEVPNEDPGVEGARVGFVGDIAGHQAGGGGRTTDRKQNTYLRF